MPGGRTSLAIQAELSSPLIPEAELPAVPGSGSESRSTTESEEAFSRSPSSTVYNEFELRLGNEDFGDPTSVGSKRVAESDSECPACHKRQRCMTAQEAQAASATMGLSRESQVLLEEFVNVSTSNLSRAAAEVSWTEIKQKTIPVQLGFIYAMHLSSLDRAVHSVVSKGLKLVQNKKFAVRHSHSFT